MQSSGLLLIVVGILILFAAVTGKLDCFLTALKTCYEQNASAPTAAPTSAPTAAPNTTAPITTAVKNGNGVFI